MASASWTMRERGQRRHAVGEQGAERAGEPRRSILASSSPSSGRRSSQRHQRQARRPAPLPASDRDAPRHERQQQPPVVLDAVADRDTIRVGQGSGAPASANIGVNCGHDDGQQDDDRDRPPATSKQRRVDQRRLDCSPERLGSLQKLGEPLKDLVAARRRPRRRAPCRCRTAGTARRAAERVGKRAAAPHLFERSASTAPRRLGCRRARPASVERLIEGQAGLRAGRELAGQISRSGPGADRGRLRSRADVAPEQRAERPPRSRRRGSADGPGRGRRVDDGRRLGRLHLAVDELARAVTAL